MTDTLPDRLQAALGSTHVIERELGGGGMSRVFLADETRFHRRVVIKVLAPELTEGLSAERFEREIALAAGLQQANVVPVLTAGGVEGLPWYSMPYVDGESLRARMYRGVVPVAEAVKVLGDVMRALAYAHGRGIVHRDIKPENVLLSGGAAVVTDFGIAKAVSASRTQAPGGTLTVLGTSIGTPAYMSPEQAAGDEVDHRADLYSWGVMAYELLAGAHPFADKTTSAKLMAAHVSETPVPLATAASAVNASRVLPASLASLVMHTLAKDPEARPASATAILAALDDVPISSTSSATIRSSRGKRMPLTVGAVVLVALVAGLWAWRVRGASAVTDERLVVVLPFRTAGADSSLRYLREGMVDYLAAKLTGSTRVADPRTALAAWRAAGGTEMADLDAATATKLGARLGAREVLLGDINMSEAGVVLHALLIPVKGGEPREARAEGPRDSIPALVDRLAVQLLALRSGQKTRELAGLAGTPFPAIREYLEGQQFSRRGEYERGMEKYKAAVAADSNFAAAWYGVLDMSGWLSSGVMEDSASRQITRLRDRLTPATRALVDARVGPAWPIANTVAEMQRLAERATEVAPDNVAAWEYLGESLFHWAPTIGVADAHRRAARAFERALALDSSYTSALEHLPQLYYEEGDTSAVRRAIEARLARDSTSSISLLQQYAADVMLGDKARGRQWRSAERRTQEIALLALFGQYQALPIAAVDSVLLTRVGRGVTDAERANEAWVIYQFAIQRGQPERAERAARSVPTLLTSRPLATTRVLNAVFADADSVAGAGARITLEGVLAQDSVGPRRIAWFAASLYDLHHGNRETARRTAAKLRALPPAACSRVTPRECAALAAVLEAQLAAEERRPDAQMRLVALDSVLREGIVRTGVLPQVGNLVVARLWERAGDPSRALSAVRRRTSFNGWDSMRPVSFREEGRLAAAAGDRDGAIRAYRAYLSMRDGAEPVLAPELAGVRKELARLERMAR